MTHYVMTPSAGTEKKLNTDAQLQTFSYTVAPKLSEIAPLVDPFVSV